MRIKKLLITLGCAAILITGGGVIFHNLNYKKAYASPVAQTPKVIFANPAEQMDNAIAKVTIPKDTSKNDKTLANEALNFIKLGSPKNAKSWVEPIKNTELKNELYKLIDFAAKEEANNNKGQLTSAPGVANDIFANTEYQGISNEAITGSVNYASKHMIPDTDFKVITHYYNPNVLTEKTFINFYLNIVKRDTSKDQVSYILRDIYNPNYGFILSNKTNENSEFNYGNINPYNHIVLNDNLHYAGLRNNNTTVIAFHSTTPRDKQVPFILKK